MSLLEVRNLTIHYVTDDATFKAVNNISFDIHQGKTLGLVGETGAGKTTTALGILRLVSDPPGKIINGDVLFNGESLLAKSSYEMRKIRGNQISIIFQDPMTSLNPVVRIGEQINEVIRLHQKLSRAEAEKKSCEMLELVGISAERIKEYPHQFSGGMKQRVVIAMALACNPALLIADEPTTALDVTIQAQVVEMMTGLKRKLGTAMMLITHDLGIVAEICDNVAIMYAGEIVEYGALTQVYLEPKHPYTKGLFGAVPNINATAERLRPILGLMPDPSGLPPGCHFGPRCPHWTAACSAENPSIVRVAPGHTVKCVLYGNGGAGL